MNVNGRNVVHLKGTSEACGITWQRTPAERARDAYHYPSPLTLAYAHGAALLAGRVFFALVALDGDEQHGRLRA
jgi:hypothetical protein